MYVHLGGNCLIRSEEMIAILNFQGKRDNHPQLSGVDGKPLKVVDLTRGGKHYSCIVTDKKLYLSAISAITIKKRASAGLLTIEEDA